AAAHAGGGLRLFARRRGVPTAIRTAAAGAGDGCGAVANRTPGAAADRRARTPHVRLFLGADESVEWARARSLADAVALQHRRGRLRPHRLWRRRGARLDHPRPGT